MPSVIKFSVKDGKIKPYAARVVTDGRVQRAFAKQIGKPVGACVAGKVKKGMSATRIQEIVADCSKRYKGKKLSLARAPTKRQKRK